RFVRVRLTPPNSLDVVRPTSTAPASRTRRTSAESCVATSSCSGTLACVYGHPATESSSFTPTGTPPKGASRSARAAASCAASSSRYEKALRSERSMAASVTSSSSSGVRSPERNASTSEHASPTHGVSVTSGMLRAPRRRYFGRGRERRDEAQRVLNHGSGVLGGDAGDRVARHDELVPEVHRIEREVRHADVHRNADTDDRRGAQVAEDRIQLGA